MTTTDRAVYELVNAAYRQFGGKGSTPVRILRTSNIEYRILNKRKKKTNG